MPTTGFVAVQPVVVSVTGLPKIDAICLPLES